MFEAMKAQNAVCFNAAKFSAHGVPEDHVWLPQDMKFHATLCMLQLSV